jgi:UDP-N-acetylglucosamine 1-carboxyvinyltransferase
LLTQCEGESRIHETLFEGRLGYLAELEKMGAKTEISNPHQAIVRGATPLRGAHIFSSDIRAGAAMVLAALVANGETRISDINYIDRGYEELDAKLRSLGASIERIQAM